MTGGDHVICPVCRHAMARLDYAPVTLCDHCGFSVTELEAQQWGARTAQEAAALKCQYLLAQGWSHGF